MGTTSEQKDSDIVVDWGDGTIEKISKLSNQNITKENFDALEKKNGLIYYKVNAAAGLVLAHTYKKSGKYIIRIFGNKYYTLRFGPYGYKNETAHSGWMNSKYNLVCNAITETLPLNKCVSNISSGLSYAKRLLKFEIPYLFQFNPIIHASSLLFGCENLLYADFNSGVNIINPSMRSINNLIHDCKHLKYFDISVPHDIFDCGKFLMNCENLSCDILNILPNNGIYAENIIMENAFQNCKNITCSNYERLSQLLWNNSHASFALTTKCFNGCEKLDLTKIPTTWGGKLD
jgi:hypothetical protein